MYVYVYALFFCLLVMCFCVYDPGGLLVCVRRYIF